jgi:hypothetical protein
MKNSGRRGKKPKNGKLVIESAGVKTIISEVKPAMGLAIKDMLDNKRNDI